MCIVKALHSSSSSVGILQALRTFADSLVYVRLECVAVFVRVCVCVCEWR